MGKIEFAGKMKNPLFRFFTYEINELNSEIAKNKKELCILARKQESLKRGRAELVALRREVK